MFVDVKSHLLKTEGVINAPKHTYPNWFNESRNFFDEHFDVEAIAQSTGDVLYKPLINAIGQGRRIRPALFLAIAKTEEGCFPTGQAQTLSVALELFHAASIIVDDLADKEDIRRDKSPVFQLYGEELAVLSSHALVAMGFSKLAAVNKGHDFINLWCKSYAEACIGQSMDYRISKKFCLHEQQKISLKKTESFFCFAGACLELLYNKRGFREAFKSIGSMFQISNDVIDLLNMDSSLRLKERSKYPLRLSFLVPILIEKNILNKDEIFSNVSNDRLADISISSKNILPILSDKLEHEYKKNVRIISDLPLNKLQVEQCIEFMGQCCTYSFWNHDHA